MTDISGRLNIARQVLRLDPEDAKALAPMTRRDAVNLLIQRGTIEDLRNAWDELDRLDAEDRAHG